MLGVRFWSTAPISHPQPLPHPCRLLGLTAGGDPVSTEGLRSCTPDLWAQPGPLSSAHLAPSSASDRQLRRKSSPLGAGQAPAPQKHGVALHCPVPATAPGWQRRAPGPAGSTPSPSLWAPSRPHRTQGQARLHLLSLGDRWKKERAAGGPPGQPPVAGDSVRRRGI